MANSSKGEDPRSSVSAGEVDGRPLVVPEMAFSFGPFRLLPRQHLLLQDGNPIPLGSRAFEILVALVERAGELLDRNSLGTRLARHQRRRVQSSCPKSSLCGAYSLKVAPA
jgi:DNA-binding response OmpR family regulator